MVWLVREIIQDITYIKFNNKTIMFKVKITFKIFKIFKTFKTFKFSKMYFI
jgi:hypothetical protein